MSKKNLASLAIGTVVALVTLGGLAVASGAVVLWAMVPVAAVVVGDIISRVDWDCERLV